MIEKLKQKRAILDMNREQLAASLNATIGAIQLIDELIAEHDADMAKPPEDGGAA